MSATQANRQFAVETPLGSDVLLLSTVHWNECLGEPFHGNVSMLSESTNLDAKDILGKSITIRLDKESDAMLAGLVVAFSRGAQQGGYTSYHAEVVPWISLLKFSGGNRIFQQKSVIDIFKSVAEDAGYSAQLNDRTSATYRVRPYCVQYQESDYHFLNRLLQEEGIYYYFIYSEDGHELVLADDIGGHDSFSGFSSLPYAQDDNMAKAACVFDWQSTARYSTSNFTYRDYDFQKPRAEMTVRQGNAASNGNSTWYQFPGRYFDPNDGQQYARVRSESAGSEQSSYSVNTNVVSTRCGVTLSITGHPNDEANQEYLLTSTSIIAVGSSVQSGTNQAETFNCQADLQPSATPYRAALKFSKPGSNGPHIATVVGNDDEEIWTDSYGRIKVQFAWDLDGKNDDSSSCWIRCVQPWTGKGYGAISIPRVGEEVLIQFVDGDIDRPICVGRVNNADHMPPEALADNQAKTVFRTRSTKGGDVDNFHELTFDDTKDSESIYFHSERDFHRVVENNDILEVGFDKQDSGDQTTKIYNDQTVEIGVGSGSGSLKLTIQKDRTTELSDGDDSLTIDKGNQTVEISKGNQSVTIDKGDQTVAISEGNHSLNAGNQITLEAKQGIILKCGSSEINITQQSVEIKSAQISLQGQAKVAIQGADVTASADGNLQMSGNAGASIQSAAIVKVQGSMVNIN